MNAYTLNTLRAEIKEQCSGGERPTDKEERRFWAEFFPLDYGWDGIVDDVARDIGIERDLERLIKDALSGHPEGAGKYAAMLSIGKIIVGLAEERSASEVGDMIEEFLNQESPDHGYDRPETERVALDRSAAA